MLWNQFTEEEILVYIRWVVAYSFKLILVIKLLWLEVFGNRGRFSWKLEF